MAERKEHAALAALLMVLSTSSFTLSGFFAGPAIERVDFWHALFARFAIPLLLVAPLYLAERRRLAIEANRLQIARALFLVVSQGLFFVTSLKASLFEAIVLYNTGPFFILLLDSGYFRKRIALPALAGVALGFAGAVLVLWEGWRAAGGAFLLTGLLSGVFFALSQFSLYLGSKTSSNRSILFHTYAYGSLFSLLAACAFGRPVETVQLLPLGAGALSLLLMALCSLGNQWFRGMAYQYTANVSAMAPFLYAGIVVSAVLDIVFRNRVPGGWAMFGAACIVAGALTPSLLGAAGRRRLARAERAPGTALR